jgi:hypothetical protein
MMAPDIYESEEKNGKKVFQKTMEEEE